jgi:hypothetical protein
MFSDKSRTTVEPGLPVPEARPKSTFWPKQLWLADTAAKASAALKKAFRK